MKKEKTFNEDESSKEMKIFRDMIAYYDSLFPFLPKNNMLYMIYSWPALEAYGYPLERYRKLVKGEELAEIEKDLLLWAYNIAFGVVAAYGEKNKRKQVKY